MAELKTRPPTGQVAFPLILVEGEQKAGKTYALAQLSASPRVGRTFVLDTGDGTADEYASLGPYEVLVHDGTWSSMIGQIRAAAAAAPHEGRPNVIGVDSGTDVWGLLKRWADSRARNSKRAKEALKADPDAYVETSMNYWNDSKDRWAEMVSVLRTFPGIAVITAQGAEVTKVENGQPTKETVWSIDVEKTTVANVSAHVRIVRPHSARLVGVRSLTVDVPHDGLALPSENMLDHLVFGILAGEQGFVPLSAPPMSLDQEGLRTLDAMAQVLTGVQRANGSLTEAEAKAEAARLWDAAGLPRGVEEVDAAAVTALLLDIAEGRSGPRQGGGPDTPEEGGQEVATPPQEPQDGPPAAEPPTDAPEPSTGDQEPQPSEAEMADRLESTKGQDLVDLAKSVGVSHVGKVGEIRARIAQVWGLPSTPEQWGEDPAVEEAAKKIEEAFEGATLIDVPEGWTEGRCLCGEPVTFEPGNQNATIRHLDPELDKNHQAEEPF